MVSFAKISVGFKIGFVLKSPILSVFNFLFWAFLIFEGKAFFSGHGRPS